MPFLGGLTGKIGAAKIEHLRAWWRRGIAGMMLMGFSALAALGGLGFIFAGSYLALRNMFDPWTAGVLVGGVLLVLSLVGFLVAWLFLTRGGRQRRTEKPGTEDIQVQSIASLGEALGESIGKLNISKIDVIIAAAVAGTILGASPALRQRLLNRCNRKRGNSPVRPDPYDLGT